MHRFKVGQVVDLVPMVLRQAAPGSYVITQLVPEHEDDPQYRLKSTDERYERVVPESALELSSKSPAISS